MTIITRIIFISILINYRERLMGRPKGSESKGPSKALTLEQRIRFGDYHMDLVKHPENV